MLGQIKKFQSLTRDEKIEFFLKCQELLMKYHGNSDFIIRQNNIEQRLQHAKELVDKYKGFCYMEDNICVLFNKINVGDENDPIGALSTHKFREPVEHYNAVSIDFVVFRDLKDCAEFCKNNYDHRIKYILYVKNAKPKLYKTEQFISRIFNIPIAL